MAGISRWPYFREPEYSLLFFNVKAVHEFTQTALFLSYHTHTPTHTRTHGVIRTRVSQPRPSYQLTLTSLHVHSFNDSGIGDYTCSFRMYVCVWLQLLHGCNANSSSQFVHVCWLPKRAAANSKPLNASFMLALCENLVLNFRLANNICRALTTVHQLNYVHACSK